MGEGKDSRAARLKAARQELLRRRIRGDLPASQSSGVPRRADSATAPASSAQARLYFLDRLNPDSPAYHMSMALRLRGKLDAGCLEEALSLLTARHESLRTTFTLRDGELIQDVHPQLDASVEFAELEAPPGSGQEADLQRCVAAVANRPFDLQAGPLLRPALIRCAEDEHVLLLVIHHIVSDEWSNGVLLRELAAAYSTAVSGAGHGLPDLPLQYGDYAAWQQSELPRIRDAELPFWRERLESPPPPLALPQDRPRPLRLGSGGQICRRRMPALVASGIERLAERHGATPFTVTLAAFQVLLWRYTGQNDLLVGTPAANRDRPEFEHLVGLFLNSVVIRGRLDGAASFEDHLRATRTVTMEALAHQALPFEELVQALQPERDASRNPLFQVMLVQENESYEQLAFQGLTVSRVPLDLRVAKLDLTCFVRLGAEGLETAIEFSTDLFDAESMDRMLAAFETLLVSVTENPGQRLDEVALIAPDEAARLLMLGQGETLTGTDASLLPSQIARHAASQAEALRSGESGLSYAQLARRVKELAAALVEAGLRRGGLVPVHLGAGIDQIIAILAVWRAGGAYVPLDPEYPEERRAAVVADLAQSGVLAPCAVTSGADELPGADLLWVRMDQEHRGAADVERFEVRADDLAYVLYTSGSTGQPKGVAVTHGNLAASTAARLAYYRETPARYLLLSSFAFDSSVAGIFWTLATGGTLVIASSEERRDPRLIAGLLARERITHTLMLPQLHALTLEAAEPARLEDLHTVIVAGEACPPDLPGKHFRVLPAVALYNEYGPTEATVWATVHRCAPDDGSPVPIGHAIPGMAALVLDHRRQLVPQGTPGELSLAGPSLAAGYLGDAERTNAVFRAHAQAPGGRIYCTGDRVRFDAAGRLVFLGRIDEQIKLRGHRIEPGEIAMRLSDLPGVSDAHVGLDESSRVPRLVAWLAPAAAADPPALRAALARQLPKFMLPDVFVGMPELPRGPNGKLDTARLPPPTPTAVADPAAEPLAGLEAQLAALWSELLDVEVTDPEANFFECGGHSLVGVSMMMEVGRRLGVELPLAALFEAPTVRGLAERIRTRQGEGEDSPLIPVRPGGSAPPLFCLHNGARLMARHFGSDQPVYLLFRRVGEAPGDDVTVERLAAEYLREIRRVQPAGPYHFIGFSVGALIAVEMAQTLAAEGEKVALLALCEPPLADAALFYRQRWALARARLAAAPSLAARMRTALGLVGEFAGRRVRSLTMHARRWLPSGGAATGTARPESAEVLRWREGRGYRKLYERYQQRPYAGDVAMFLPESERVNYDQTRAFWAGYFPGRFTLQLVAGAQSHVDLIDEQGGAAIARQVARLMAGEWPDEPGT